MAGKKRNRDLEFLYEVGSLRFLQRTWRQFLNPDFGSISDHLFRVAWIALVIARKEGVKDEEKILKMALIHDIPESRTLDVNYVSRMYSSRNEDLAITDMLKDTVLEDLKALFEEYEKRETIEAKIVKDADNLDVDMELQEQESQGSNVKKYMPRTNMDKRLFTKTAKKMFAEIKKSDPHDWHLFGRNRFTAGDWKDK